MKKFILKSVYVSLPVLIILISVSYSNIYSTDKGLKEMAVYLSEGYNITAGDDLSGNSFDNEWLFQKYFVEYLKNEPDIVILGSSRSMLINSDLFPQKLINNSVAGASLEDLLAIYSLYPKRNYKPKTIVLGLDPWFLNENCKQLRWYSIADDFYKMLNIIGLKKYVVNKTIDFSMVECKMEKIKNLLSFSYFQQSLEIFGSKTKYIPTKISVNDKITRQLDGSVIYDKKYREADSARIVNSSKTFAEAPFSLQNFSKFSSRNKEIIEKFIQYLEKQDIKLIFFLSPFHPIVYNSFKTNEKYQIVLETENYYQELAQKHHIEVIGSFNPYTYKLGNMAFTDADHCSLIAIKQIFNSRNDHLR